jgi:hypothetical protein
MNPMAFATTAAGSATPARSATRPRATGSPVRAPATAARTVSTRWPAATFPRSSRAASAPGATAVTYWRTLRSTGPTAASGTASRLAIACAESDRASSSTPAGLFASIRSTRVRAQPTARARTLSPSSVARAPATTCFRGPWAGPSVMRTSRPKISASGEPRREAGTGSAGGRTRTRGLVRTAVTASALAATQSPRSRSRCSGRVATISR